MKNNNNLKKENVKKFYLISVSVFLVLLFGVVFFLNSDDADMITGYTIKDSNPTNACVVYEHNTLDDFCPDNRDFVFSVGIEFFKPGGAHVFSSDRSPWNLCCKDIEEGDEHGVLVFETDLRGGNHAFDPEVFDLIEEPRRGRFELVSVGNKIEVVDYGQDCPARYECMFKVSKFGRVFNDINHEFYNTHIWNCEVEFANLRKVCYETGEFCLNELDECDFEDIGKINYETGLYCSGGVNESGVNDSGELKGICCPRQTYYRVHRGMPGCEDASPCGFKEGSLCPLGHVDGNTSNPPIGYFEEPYFNTGSCVNLNTMRSCCFNVTMYGTTGNFYCPIVTLDEGG